MVLSYKEDSAFNVGVDYVCDNALIDSGFTVIAFTNESERNDYSCGVVRHNFQAWRLQIVISRIVSQFSKSWQPFWRRSSTNGVSSLN